MKRDEYLSHFDRVDETDPVTGKTVSKSVYKGLWFAIKPEALRSYKRKLLPCYIVAVICFLVAVLLPVGTASGWVWVEAACLFCMVPFLYILPGVVRSMKLKPRFNELDKDDTFTRVRNCGVAIGLLASLWVLLASIAMIRDGLGELPGVDIAFTLLGLPVAAAGFILYNAGDHTPYSQVFDEAAFAKDDQESLS